MAAHPYRNQRLRRQPVYQFSYCDRPQSTVLLLERSEPAGAQHVPAGSNPGADGGGQLDKELQYTWRVHRYPEQADSPSADPGRRVGIDILESSNDVLRRRTLYLKREESGRELLRGVRVPR